MIDRDKLLADFDYQCLCNVGNMPEDAKVLMEICQGHLRDQFVALLDRLEASHQVLTAWQQNGCPDCGGDCASANPPVCGCLMQNTARVLSGRPL